VTAAIGLHLDIGVFIGLWMFAVMVMIMTFAGFGFNLLPQVREWAVLEPGIEEFGERKLFELIVRLQNNATVPMIDIRAYSKWLAG
jgi:hypothetical protein